jgi:hypothetical protein
VAVARMPQLEETLASLHDADDPGGSGGAGFGSRECGSVRCVLLGLSPD